MHEAAMHIEVQKCGGGDDVNIECTKIAFTTHCAACKNVKKCVGGHGIWMALRYESGSGGIISAKSFEEGRGNYDWHIND